MALSDLPVSFIYLAVFPNLHMIKIMPEQASNRTYANYFCALCHDDVADLMGYNATLSCTNADIVESCEISVLDDIAREDNYIQVSIQGDPSG